MSGSCPNWDGKKKHGRHWERPVIHDPCKSIVRLCNFCVVCGKTLIMDDCTPVKLVGVPPLDGNFYYDVEEDNHTVMEW